MTEEEALRRIASYCATVERCKSDLIEKLNKWEITPDAICRIINRLEKEKHLSR